MRAQCILYPGAARRLRILRADSAVRSTARFTLGAQLKEVAAKYLTGGDVRITILEGDPAEAIINRAKANRDCAVAMTTHGLSGLRLWLPGQHCPQGGPGRRKSVAPDPAAGKCSGG